MYKITEQLIKEAVDSMFSGRRESEEVLDVVVDILLENVLIK